MSFYSTHLPLLRGPGTGPEAEGGLEKVPEFHDSVPRVLGGLIVALELFWAKPLSFSAVMARPRGKGGVKIAHRLTIPSGTGTKLSAVYTVC